MLPPHVNSLFENLKGQTEPEHPVKSQNIADEVTWVRMTICKWRANAQIQGKAQAKADCDRLLHFINSICPN